MITFFNILAGNINSKEASDKYISTQSQFDALSINSGDNIYFQKGNSFLNNGLNVPSDVTFGSFGSGNKPIIHGKNSLSNLWINNNGNLWKNSLNDNVKWVFINGECAEIAQIETTLATKPAVNKFTVSDTIPSDLVGAKCQLMRFNFRFEDQRIIIDSTGGILTVNENLSFSVNNMPVIIYDHKNLLTSENQWYYDDILNELWIYSTTDPNLKDITYGVADYGFNLQGNNITFDGIELGQYYLSGIYGDTIDNFTFKNSTIKNIRNDGIHLTGICDNVIIDDNLFEDCGNNGIVFNGWTNSFIRRNTGNRFGQQANVPMFWNYPEVYKTGGCFVASCANNFTVDTLHKPDNILYDGNILTDHAYMGILHVGNDSTMRNNNVSNVCSFFKDGGALYTWGNYYSYPGVTTDNCLIEDNTCNIQNNENNIIVAIYTDDGTTNTLVQNNVAYKANAWTVYKDGSFNIIPGESSTVFTNNTEIIGTP